MGLQFQFSCTVVDTTVDRFSCGSLCVYVCVCMCRCVLGRIDTQGQLPPQGLLDCLTYTGLFKIKEQLMAHVSGVAV